MTQRKALYARVVAQVTLRTVHEMFQSDRTGHIESIVFNGHVDTIDPRTGHPVRPCLIALRQRMIYLIRSIWRAWSLRHACVG